jgi:hypothetical protein
MIIFFVVLAFSALIGCTVFPCAPIWTDAQTLFDRPHAIEALGTVIGGTT